MYRSLYPRISGRVGAVLMTERNATVYQGHATFRAGKKLPFSVGMESTFSFGSSAISQADNRPSDVWFSSGTGSRRHVAQARSRVFK